MSKNRNFLRRIIAACMLLMMSMAARSETGLEMNFKKLVSLSDNIAIGTCISVNSDWVGNKIITMAEVSVEQTIKGNAAEQVLTLKAYGGSAVHPVLKTRMTMQIEGGVTFKPQQKMVLFSALDSNGDRRVVGMAQGYFPVNVTEDGIEIVPLAEKKTIVKAVESELVISAETVELAEFVGLIKEQVGKNGN